MSRTSSGATPRRERVRPALSPAAGGYLEESERPLASLVFLLPLIVIYEVGTRYANANSDIIAFDLMRSFFRVLGAGGRYLPALAVVAILLAWHIAKGDRWRVSPRTIGWMALESIGMGAPVIILNMLTRHYVPLAAGPRESFGSFVTSSVGAGIYEELVFRLIAFTILSLILSDWLGIRKPYDLLLVVAISAILFSLYHYLGPEQFRLQSFVFRTLAGAYFGVVFLTRGFGITAGSHAFYDILVNVILMLRGV